MRNATSNRKSPRPISAADVGRFLKHLASTLRDPVTGNPAMSEALLNLSTVLIDAKHSKPEATADRFMSQGGFDFDDEIDFSGLSTDEVMKALQKLSLTKPQLVILGVERFGIARSRLEKLSRDEISQLISAASEHENSLNIISEQARQGGSSRSS